VVGPKVGEELIRDGILATLLAMVAIARIHLAAFRMAISASAA
jgi:preprotein translocase subunit SecF